MPDFDCQALGSSEYTAWKTGERTLGKSRAPGWRKMLFVVLDPSLPRADFLNISGYELGCAQRVADRLSPLLESSGDVLPIEVEGASEPYVLWNIVQEIDALDNARSNWETAVRLVDARYEFHADRLPSTPQVFRVKNPASVIFSLGIGDGTDLVSRYRALGLTGLEFKQVWESS
jgi:hypothetical protein